MGAPQVLPQSPTLVGTTGTFWRAVDPRHRDAALTGSRSAGRYSRPGQPTLYLSVSAQRVQAAMIAHRRERASTLELVAVEVAASDLVDLRDERARRAAGIRADDAVAPWQVIIADGGEPPSWGVRDRLEELGVHGLIDPSRRSPGLWHLVLFCWNEKGAATVRLNAESSLHCREI